MIHSLVMPFIILNLGTEMLYILQQRLQAQKINPSKSARVLTDVTKTMLTNELLEALWKRQPVYSHKDTREIFDRLAHSSIMRLSKPSMDKLYDLMTMGLKYQLLQCRESCELFQLTLNHLFSILEMIDERETINVITNVIEKTKEMSQKFTFADWKLVQEQLYDFFQDRHVKVSLFLSSGIQYQNGFYKLEKHESLVLPYSNGCGTVTFYQKGEACHSQTIADHPNVHITPIKDASHLNSNKLVCMYGFNMYHNQKAKSLEPSINQNNIIGDESNGTNNEVIESSSTENTESLPEPSQNNLEFIHSNNNDHLAGNDSSFKINKLNIGYSNSNSSYAALPKSTTATESKTSEEFNLLANIIGGVSREMKGKIENENILHISNLFGKDEDPLVSDVELESLGINTSHPSIESLRFSTSRDVSQLSQLMKDFDIDDKTQDNSQKDEGQDLLDLMDMI